MSSARRTGSARAHAWRGLHVWCGGLLLTLLATAGCSRERAPQEATRATPPIAAPSGAASAPQESAQDVQSAVPQPAPSDAAWIVDLRRDEQRGGHTLARHVGRTDAQLRARLQRESIAAASTYADRETAERVVSVALAENERRVQRWIDQRLPKANLAVRYRARDDVPTGRVLRRGADASQPATGAVVVLRWRGDDWYVLTSYPENVR